MLVKWIDCDDATNVYFDMMLDYEEEMYDGERLGYARFLKMCSEKKRLTPDEHGGWFAAPGWHIVPVE